MVGLGVMGRNLSLNIAGPGFAVAGYDKDIEKIKSLNKEVSGKSIHGLENIKDFIESLDSPKVVMLLVPAGALVDDVISDVLPLLSENDMLIDAGNSFFEDTNKRSDRLPKEKMFYLGVGVSGGKHGARFGPSMMPGGPEEAHQHVKDNLIFAIAGASASRTCRNRTGKRQKTQN